MKVILPSLVSSDKTGVKARAPRSRPRNPAFLSPLPESIGLGKLSEVSPCLFLLYHGDNTCSYVIKGRLQRRVSTYRRMKEGRRRLLFLVLFVHDSELTPE